MRRERGGSRNKGEAERGTKLNKVIRNLNGKYEPIILIITVLASLPIVSVVPSHQIRHTLQFSSNKPPYNLVAETIFNYGLSHKRVAMRFSSNTERVSTTHYGRLPD